MVALAVSLIACADMIEIDSIDQEILGGTPAPVGAFPTVVAVANSGLCTGTLISPDWVLTAAHCILAAALGFSSQQQVTDNTFIILDTDNIFGGGGTQRQAADTIPHPSFRLNGLGDNDIGLVRLQTAVTDRAGTPINRFNEDARSGIAVDMVGYGATQVGGGGSGSLFVLLDKVTTSCSNFGVSDANLICFTQTDGTGKCQGDSGGPSFATIGGVQRVVGVTSFGDQTCAQFGADTRVDSELDFLFNNAPELQCQADGACNEECGRGGLPFDPDCIRCTNDPECGNDRVCTADGLCIAAPFTPGGDGSECTVNEDCESDMCSTSTDGNICTSSCASNDDCFDGFECIPAQTLNVCWPSSGGGCSIGGHSDEAPIGVVLLVLVLALLGRRRRHGRALR